MIFIDMITIHAEFLENIYNLNAKKAKNQVGFCLFLQINFRL